MRLVLSRGFAVRFLSTLLATLLLAPWAAFASVVDVAVVDLVAPVTEVDVAPGTETPVVIRCVVTGPQGGTSTFEVYTRWTLTSGGFVGSMPVEVSIPARANLDPPTVRTVDATVVVPAGTTAGARQLVVRVVPDSIENEKPPNLREGSSAAYTVNVVVGDTTPPVLSLPGDIVAEATGPDGAVVHWSATAVDDHDGPVPVTCEPASGSTFPLGETVVACSATDAAGNTATGSFKVTVVDTTPPELTVPADVFAYATSSAGAVVTFSAPSATDLVDRAPVVTCDWASGATFPLGLTWVTCTATDFSGNSVTKSFRVTVVYEWSGVLQPVNPDGSSIFKAGSTIPVKFRLTGASAGITDAVARVYVARIEDEVIGAEVEASSSTPASVGNLFRYDPTDDLYIYNYGTKGMQPGTYQLRIDLGDGATHIVRIGLRK